MICKSQAENIRILFGKFLFNLLISVYSVPLWLDKLFLNRRGRSEKFLVRVSVPQESRVPRRRKLFKTENAEKKQVLGVTLKE
ncbi:hypothetical protein NIES2100_02270 [Calothrix sp. NIES-2100]|nr:hypothetical protein NIES2100_02270 [Calothrix sp. NIES-2100]